MIRSLKIKKKIAGLLEEMAFFGLTKVSTGVRCRESFVRNNRAFDLTVPLKGVTKQLGKYLKY